MSIRYITAIVSVLLPVLILLWQGGCTAVAPAPLPSLHKTNDITQLHVDHQPFLILGGELGNSTASHLPTLDAALAKCRRMHLNTVLLPVYWDLIEPTEGNFDFTLVRGAIDLARAHDLRLVFLWFGTWKNSMSCYTPGWVKRDTTRFPRALRSNGEPMEIISPESPQARNADAHAFAALMRFTRDYDSAHRTVVMVQVENEVGMIPEPRDHSDFSELAYNAPVPPPVLSLATGRQLGPEVTAIWERAGSKTHGTWPEVFGASPQGEEIFTAWQLATYVEQIAIAGKSEYALPMFTNAALIRPNYQPGQYPSAGPLPHLLEIWRAGAPSLDFISPDIYFPNFMEWCHRYVRNGNPLFIPEMAASARAPANALYAIGQYAAIGTGPFSIENVDSQKERALSDCYALLSNLAPHILLAQQSHSILALSPQVGFDWTTPDDPQHGQLADIHFTARFDRPTTPGSTTATTLPTLGTGRWDAPPNTPLGAALILQLAPDEFLIAGSGTVVTFSPTTGSAKIGIQHAQEGTFTPNGTWQGGRHLNGDETHQGRHIHLYPNTWTCQRVRLYRY